MQMQSVSPPRSRVLFSLAVSFQRPVSPPPFMQLETRTAPGQGVYSGGRPAAGAGVLCKKSSSPPQRRAPVVPRVPQLPARRRFRWEVTGN